MNVRRHPLGAVLALVVSLLTACATVLPTGDATEKSARAFATTFLRAFENLDMATFIACFATDATVFLPDPDPPMRYDGQGAIRDYFQSVFDEIRGDSMAGPPYHRLNPELLRVQVLDDDAAVITFHMTGPGRVARRTLVLHRQGGRWLIAHLHASNGVAR